MEPPNQVSTRSRVGPSDIIPQTADPESLVRSRSQEGRTQPAPAPGPIEVEPSVPQEDPRRTVAPDASEPSPTDGPPSAGPGTSAVPLPSEQVASPLASAGETSVPPLARAPGPLGSGAAFFAAAPASAPPGSPRQGAQPISVGVAAAEPVPAAAERHMAQTTGRMTASSPPDDQFKSLLRSILEESTTPDGRIAPAVQTMLGMSGPHPVRSTPPEPHVPPVTVEPVRTETTDNRMPDRRAAELVASPRDTRSDTREAQPAGAQAVHRDPTELTLLARHLGYAVEAGPDGTMVARRPRPLQPEAHYYGDNTSSGVETPERQVFGRKKKNSHRSESPAARDRDADLRSLPAMEGSSPSESDLETDPVHAMPRKQAQAISILTGRRIHTYVTSPDFAETVAHRLFQSRAFLRPLRATIARELEQAAGELKATLPAGPPHLDTRRARPTRGEPVWKPTETLDGTSIVEGSVLLPSPAASDSDDVESERPRATRGQPPSVGRGTASDRSERSSVRDKPKREKTSRRPDNGGDPDSSSSDSDRASPSPDGLPRRGPPGDSDEYFEEDTATVARFRPTQELYAPACNFESYRLSNRNARYNRADAKRMKSFLRDTNVQMKGRHFDGRPEIAVLNFLSAFKRACDINGVHEGAAIYLFRHFLAGNARTDFEAQLDGPTPEPDDADSLTTYCEVVSYLLRTYATNEAISAAHSELISFRQTVKMTEKQYADLLLSKAGRCGRVYPRRVVRGYFVEGVLEDVRPAVRDYLAAHPAAQIYELVNHATTMGRVAGRSSQPSAAPGHTGGPASSGADRSGGKHRQGRTVNLVSEPSDSSFGSAMRTDAPPTPANHVFAVEQGQAAGTSSIYSTTVGSFAPSNPMDGQEVAAMAPAVTCQLCLDPGCPWPNCPLLAHLNPQEKLDFIARRSTNLQQHIQQKQMYSGNRRFSSQPSQDQGRDLGNRNRRNSNRSYSTRGNAPPGNGSANNGGAPAPRQQNQRPAGN